MTVSSAFDSMDPLSSLVVHLLFWGVPQIGCLTLSAKFWPFFGVVFCELLD